MSVRLRDSSGSVAHQAWYGYCCCDMSDLMPIGATAHLGVKEAINFTIRYASYTVIPEQVDGKLIVPNVSQKLVVLKVLLQYPEEGRIELRPSDIHVAAVEMSGMRHEGQFQFYLNNRRPISTVNLRSGQQIESTCVIVAPASAVVLKLDAYALDRRLQVSFKGDGIQPLPVQYLDIKGGNKITPAGILDTNLGQTVCIGEATVLLKRGISQSVSKSSEDTELLIEIGNPNKLPILIGDMKFVIMHERDGKRRICSMEWLGDGNSRDIRQCAPLRYLTARVGVKGLQFQAKDVLLVTDRTTGRGMRVAI